MREAEVISQEGRSLVIRSVPETTTLAELPSGSVAFSQSESPDSPLKVLIRRTMLEHLTEVNHELP